MNISSANDTNRGTPGPGRYLVLNFGGLHLLLPHTEVYTLEPRSDVQAGADGEQAAGWLAAEGQSWPVVCFDADLELTTLVPVERRVCVLLHYGGGYAGVLCDAVATLEAEDVQVFSLPPALRASATPVRGLVTYDGLLGCLTSSRVLLSRLPVSADSRSRPSPDPFSVNEAHP